MDKLYRAARRYGVTRSQVLEWLQLQPGYTLHKPGRKHFRRNRVIVFGRDSQWQADLVDLQSLSQRNRGYKYLLTCIDVLSKYRGKGASKEALVHWKGWPKKYDSWIPYKQLVSLQ